MSHPRPTIDVVSEYARTCGCTILEDAKFISPNRKRSIRFSESRNDVVIVWDTGMPLGYVRLPREERRQIEIHNRTEDQGDKAVPGEGDGNLRKVALAGQKSLEL